jgi:uncharacterized membrane protein
MDWQGWVTDGVREHGLNEAQRRALLALGGVGAEPTPVVQRLPLLLGGLAGLLTGLGLIFAIAANWSALPRLAQFATLQAAVALGALGLMARPALRLPLGLWCLLATGGLLAFFGQTYQTGADAWQLFALWALLGVPLALGARSDVLWAVVALVAMAAVSLWVSAHTGHGWRAEAGDLLVHVIGWALSLGLVLALSGHPGARVGAGLWARRTAACLAVLLVMAGALAALFDRDPLALTLLAVLVLAVAGVALSRPESFDLFNLSAAALALNAVLVGGMVRLLFDGPTHGDPIGRLLLLGVFAAALLAATVSGVLWASRTAGAGEAA